MELRHLTTFTTVARVGSVSAAAETLSITQPALSRQLQQLERELGIALFLRQHRRLSLTAAGQQFLGAALAVLTSAEAAQSLAASLSVGRLGRIRVAAPTTTLTDVIAPFLATLMPTDPLVTVEEAHYAHAISSLQSGTDLAIVTTPPPRHLGTIRVAVLPVWAYVCPSHPLFDAEEVSIREMAEQRLILLNTSFRPRRLIDEALIEEELAMPEAVECSNPQVAQALAAAGRGIAVVSDDPRFGLRPLHIVTRSGALNLTLHAAWDREHHAATELQRFAQRLSTFCIERYGAVRDNGDAST